MPTDTAAVVAGIVVVFAIFAAALAWASFYTRGYRAPGGVYQFPPNAGRAD
jgi:hypothetical protein